MMKDAAQQCKDEPVTISTFYKFTKIQQPKAMRDGLKRAMIGRGIRGTITLAPEGINATIAGRDELLQDMLAHLQSLPQIGAFPDKQSTHYKNPFNRTKVKVKPELISVGAPTDPTVCVGKYVDAQAWNELIVRDDVITIDTRNDYEFRIGHFEGAINPDTKGFKEMIAYTDTFLNPDTHPHVAMYCTGGIRCEKYSSYLIERGFKNVYHLNGGILQYLEDMPEKDTLWRGSCFVFDWRGAVKHDLTRDEDISICYGCGQPNTSEDRERESYTSDEECHYCQFKLEKAAKHREVLAELS